MPHWRPVSVSASLVAAGVGPIWLLCLRTSMRFGFPSGFAIGAGAAVVDTLYAALGVANAAGLLTIDPLRVTLGVVGAIVLAAIALRTLWSAFRVRLGGEASTEVASPRRAFATSLAATASNPMTIRVLPRFAFAHARGARPSGAAHCLAVGGCRFVESLVCSAAKPRCRRTVYRFPRSACSRSIDSKSALKFPSPKVVAP